MRSNQEIQEITDLVKQMRAKLEAMPHLQRLGDQEINLIFSMALGFINQGQYEQALRYFGFLMVYRPTEVRILTGLALVNRMLGRYAEAIWCYAFAAHIEPAEPEHMLAVAECELRQNDIATASNTLKLVIRYCKENGNFEWVLNRAEGLLDVISKGNESVTR